MKDRCADSECQVIVHAPMRATPPPMPVLHPHLRSRRAESVCADGMTSERAWLQLGPHPYPPVSVVDKARPPFSFPPPWPAHDPQDPPGSISSEPTHTPGLSPTHHPSRFPARHAKHP